MTTSITTIIVDDEPNSIRNLADDLAVYPEINILDTQTSPQKAKRVSSNINPIYYFSTLSFPQPTESNYCRKSDLICTTICMWYSIPHSTNT